MYNVIYNYSGLIYNIAVRSTTQWEAITTDVENEFSHWTAEHVNFNPALIERTQKTLRTY